MAFSRRALGRVLLGIGAWLAMRRASLLGQDQAPNRREFAVNAHNYAFAPDRLEVTHDDLVKIILNSPDQAHSFAIDEYRIVKRISSGGTTTFEFRADRVGTFAYYCNITTDPGCRAMRGQLIVRQK